MLSHSIGPDLVMLRQLIAIALVLPAFVAPAIAQPAPFAPQRAPQRENDLQWAEGERQHRAALKLIPDRKGSNDPWRTVRPIEKDPAIERHRPQ